MIVIYTSHGCASCRKVKTWLKDRNIKYIEKNIFNTLLNDKEIKYLLSRTENGTDVLRRPIIISDKNMQVGYDEEEIDAFVPSELRKLAICDKSCPHYPTCGYLREEEE